jgi:hypothetical protein
VLEGLANEAREGGKAYGLIRSRCRRGSDGSAETKIINGFVGTRDRPRMAVLYLCRVTPLDVFAACRVRPHFLSNLPPFLP